MAITLPDDSLKLIYLVHELGEYALVPDNAVVSIGGVKGPTFTVGGKPLMFADGTSTDGTSATFLKPDFQAIYANSGAEATVDFTSGKDLVLRAVNDKEFRFDADTGDVTITGNLVIKGSATSLVDVDRVIVRQSAGNYVPLRIEPAKGVVPQVNVVDIKVAQGGPSVFSVGPTGETYIYSLKTGLINGIDIVALAGELEAHVRGPGIKHAASEISVDQADLDPLEGETVQEVLQSISNIVSTLTSQEVGDVRGFEHSQRIASTTWVVSHNQRTKRVHMTVWDEHDEQLLPDSVTIFDANTVVVRFGTPIVGRAILMLFGTTLTPLPS